MRDDGAIGAIDDARLAGIEARERAATKGPWHDDGYRIYGYTDAPDKRGGPLIVEYKHLDNENEAADGAFIEHARVDVRDMAAALRAARDILAGRDSARRARDEAIAQVKRLREEVDCAAALAARRATGMLHEIILLRLALGGILYGLGAPRAAVRALIRQSRDAMLASPELTAWVREHRFRVNPNGAFRCDSCGAQAVAAQVDGTARLPLGWAEVGENEHACPACASPSHEEQARGDTEPVEALLARVAALEAAAEGRNTPPTDAELAAHAGEWHALLSNGNSVIEHMTWPSTRDYWIARGAVHWWPVRAGRHVPCPVGGSAEAHP